MRVSGKPLKPSLTFVSKAEGYQNETRFRYSTSKWSPGLTHKHSTRLEMLAGDQHSSFLRVIVNFGRKSFIRLRPGSGVQTRKLFSPSLTLWQNKEMLLLESFFGLDLGNCNKFYFTFEFEVQMWVWIYQIFKRDQIPIGQSNLNTDKPTDFWIRSNVNEYNKLVKNWDGTICKL